MKFFLISDNIDTLMGMRLSGIEGVVVHEKHEVRDALNKALIEKGLTKAHCIGGAYFRKLEGDDFKALWDYHLEGIIFEYFRGEPDAQFKIDDIKKAYDDAALPEQAPETEVSTSTEETSAE